MVQDNLGVGEKPGLQAPNMPDRAGKSLQACYNVSIQSEGGRFNASGMIEHTSCMA